MKALEERQLSILKRLEMLKKQVTGIDEQLGRKFGDSVPEDVQCVRSKVRFGYFHTIQIFCNL